MKPRMKMARLSAAVFDTFYTHTWQRGIVKERPDFNPGGPTYMVPVIHTFELVSSMIKNLFFN